MWPRTAACQQKGYVIIDMYGIVNTNVNVGEDTLIHCNFFSSF